ncbi:MAG: anthrone oxygenase family protein [Steroidobacteraceae bacterium]
MLTSLPLLVCIGAGLIGGVFFAFSSFVMKALAELPAAHGIAAMQRINVVVLNPLFLGVFIGTAVLSAMCVIAGFFPWGTGRSLLLLTAGVIYLLGSFGVTVAFSVPRNERLAGMAADTIQAREYYPLASFCHKVLIALYENETTFAAAMCRRPPSSSSTSIATLPGGAR